MAKKDKIGLCNDCDTQMVRIDDTWVGCPNVNGCGYQDVQPHPDRVEKAECTHMRVGKEPCVACGGKRESDTKDPSTLDKAFSSGWDIISKSVNEVNR